MDVYNIHLRRLLVGRQQVLSGNKIALSVLLGIGLTEINEVFTVFHSLPLQYGS